MKSHFNENTDYNDGTGDWCPLVCVVVVHCLSRFMHVVLLKSVTVFTLFPCLFSSSSSSHSDRLRQEVRHSQWEGNRPKEGKGKRGKGRQSFEKWHTRTAVERRETHLLFHPLLRSCRHHAAAAWSPHGVGGADDHSGGRHDHIDSRSDTKGDNTGKTWGEGRG